MNKAMTICDRVYAVGGPSLSAPEDCCVYLVDAGFELVLIDSGVGYGMAIIEKNIKSLGFEPAQIWHAVATHCHVDHIGGMAYLKENYGSKIIAHELDRAGIEGENDDLTAASMYGLNLRHVKVDLPLRDEINKLHLGNLEFSFLHTPGHTPGSLSILIDTKDGRVLFGQDIHGPFSPQWGSNLNNWRLSMEKLLVLKADILCEGHAGVYRGEEIRKYIEAYLKRYSN
ncbi:MAG: MBL fold metallo-hydrolase [Methanotrichaceae archaeon]|nr:MBL fold metallo-hydrolase [Methanotrichaceae archaeon]